MEPADDVQLTPEKNPNITESTSRAPRTPGTVKKFRRNTTRPLLLVADTGLYEIELIPTLDEPSTKKDNSAVFEEEDPEFRSLGLLLKRRSTQKMFSLDLTAMTEQELLCFRDSVVASVEAALPTVRELDRKALDDNSADGRANKRLYRTVPSIRTGDGSTTPYLEDVRTAADPPPELVWPAGLAARRTREQIDAMADRELQVDEPGNGGAASS